MPREQPPPYQDFQQRPQDTYGHFMNQGQQGQGQGQGQEVEIGQQQQQEQMEQQDGQMGEETEIM